MDMTPEESWKAFTATGSIEAYLAYRTLTDREIPQSEDTEQDFDQQESKTNNIFYI